MSRTPRGRSRSGGARFLTTTRGRKSKPCDWWYYRIGRMARAYFDWNATALLRPEAHAATVAALGCVGNPSSIHAEGRAARRLIDQARENVAELVAAEPECVIFTSGGTEANVLALTPMVECGGPKSM